MAIAATMTGGAAVWLVTYAAAAVLTIFACMMLLGVLGVHGVHDLDAAFKCAALATGWLLTVVCIAFAFTKVIACCLLA